MGELDKLKNEISKLKKENKKLKKDLTFYKEIVDNVQIQLHINDISKEGHFDIEWANKFHTTDAAINNKERNNCEYYKKHYRAEDKKMMDDVSDAFRKDNKAHSMVYRYLNGEGNERWHYTICMPHRFSEKGKLTHILCATINLTENIFNEERYTDMIKEINNLKHQLILKELTETETKIIEFLAFGKSEKEIADMQNRSVHTIRTHLKNIRQKLNLTKNIEIVKFACATGIV